jgi:hypothetical protein
VKGGNTRSAPLGMSTFLLRGWMGWAEALPILSPPPLPAPVGAAPAPVLATPSDRDVVQAVAGLLLSYLGRSA